MDGSGTGRVALVTGTTSGIGTEIARELARQGFTVVMHGRDRTRTDAAVADVRATTGNDQVHAVLADLSKRDEVIGLADTLAAKFPAISVIVNNAAVVPQTRRSTPEGLEEAFAVNVLAPYLLGTRLSPQLRAGAPARVISFFGGGPAVVDLDDLQSERGPFDGWKTYVHSKNAVAALALELARRDAGTGVSWFVTLPGLVDTPGMRGLPGRMVWFARILGPIMRTPAQGARTPVWLATSPELEGRTGVAHGNLLGSGWRNPLQLPPSVVDPEIGRRLRETCEALT